MSSLPESNQAATVAAVGQVRRLSFHGTGGSLFGIFIVNLLLILVTLGTYYVWAKVKIRRYLWSQTEFEGDRFAYAGTGSELFIGWLKAALVFGIPFVLLKNGGEWLGVEPWLQWVAAIVAYGISLVFLPVAIVGARRYRLSRTSWRGIRFSFRGRAADFIKLFVKGSLLSAITLGLYSPLFATQRYRFLVSHSYFGHERFGFDAGDRDLFWRFILAVALTIPTLGLYWFWFLAEKQRFFWDHTFFATARFRSTVTGRRLLLLKLGNLLLLVVSGGLAWPWVKGRNIRFILDNLTLEGPLDLAGIQQQALLAPAFGEGLASFFDILDTGLDLG
ncbi:MAG: YjgN family protein [Candidatus Entotheonellia bacterium]